MIVDRAAAMRERLFEAALALAQEGGLPAVTVREVCRRAGCNVAAVNYHFGGKERLAAELIATLAEAGQARFMPQDAEAKAPTWRRLESFVGRVTAWLLEGDAAGLSAAVRLAADMPPCGAEMNAETADDLARELLSGLTDEAVAIAAEGLAGKGTENDVAACAASILCLTLGAALFAPLFRRLGLFSEGPEGVQGFARHVTVFVLGGLWSVGNCAAEQAPAAS